MLLTISSCYNIKVENCISYFTGGLCRKYMKLEVMKKSAIFPLYNNICSNL